MNKLILTTTLLFTSTITTTPTSFADENCYDQAVMALEEAKNALQKCGTSAGSTEINGLQKSLEKWTVQGVKSGKYQKRVISSIGGLYELYYTTLPYSRATKDNACVQLEVKKLPHLKETLIDSLVQCTE